ncbi:MAG: RNA polymerase-binding protein DksA [Pseudodesulfovibrio sp.]
MDAKDLQYFKDTLNGMLDDILRKSEATIEDMTESGEVYADPADRATAESDRAFTLRLRDRERKLIKKIQKAIDRIDDGEFGICQECGDNISIPRLKARPMTTLCINCKSKQEADEAVRGD